MGWGLHLLLRFGLCRLLGRETPDACVGFELRDVVGLVVVFITGTSVSGSLLVNESACRSGPGLSDLSGLSGLSGIVQSLLLLQDIGMLGGVSKEIKVLSHALLCHGSAAKRVVIEGILGFVQPIA